MFSAEAAEQWAARGERVVLVRAETSPEDVAGMHAARGILTSRGGLTSHAAVVGRGMGKTCVVGCGEITVDEDAREFRRGDLRVREGDVIALDGTTGEVILGDVPTRPSEVVQVLLENTLAAEESRLYRDWSTILGWADTTRTIGVRANADTPADAATALAFGAQGIGLCRTEHMFFKPEERIPIVREMIRARDRETRQRALDKLLPMQREDFLGILRRMAGRPVTIRLLDPPLHEFLPKEAELMKEHADLNRQLVGLELVVQSTRTLLATTPALHPMLMLGPIENEVARIRTRLGALDTILESVRSIQEANPMLGHRGLPAGDHLPGDLRDAGPGDLRGGDGPGPGGRAGRARGDDPADRHRRRDEGDLHELTARVAEAVLEEVGVRVPYSIGTMIEVPRACLVADQIAHDAAFFSFGTNDLTQLTYGYSRDDVGKFLPLYLEKELVPRDPFRVLDQEGVGELVKIAIERGRRARPELKVGICGEHGGEPASVEFCHRVGMTYVSCSPYQIPTARLAAAQARIKERRQGHGG